MKDESKEIVVREDSEVEASGLVRLALEKELPVEVLERLVALQERVSDRNARAEFFEALADFQEHMPEVRKARAAKITTKGGGSYGYTYAGLEDITRAIRQPLRQRGLSFSWTTEGVEGGVLRVVCILRHTSGHEERSAFPVPIDTAAAMSGAQKHGAALTYGRRQSLVSLLGLTTADEDTDGVEPAHKTDTITEAQALDLAALMEELAIDRQKFLDWLGVDSVDAILARDLPRATRMIERKRKAATP